MTPSSHDLCFLVTKNGMSLDKQQNPSDISCLQTGDTIFLDNSEFEKLEDESSKKFERKPILKLAACSPLKFNGMVVTKNSSSIGVRAAVSNRNLLSSVKVDLVDKDEYVAQRARGAYISFICRTDLALGFTSAAQHTDPELSHVRLLNKVIIECAGTKEQALKFVELDHNTMFIGVFFDAVFANSTDL